MQFICTNQKSGKFKSVAPYRKMAKPPHRFDRHRAKIFPNPNILASSKSPCTEYAYVGLWVKYAMGKSSWNHKIPPVEPKKQRITVSVFLSILQLTALLLKSFRLRLNYYTLRTLSGRMKQISMHLSLVTKASHIHTQQTQHTHTNTHDAVC